MAINFPDSPSSGDTFTDSTSGFTYEWNGTVWRSFDPSTAANIRELDDISSGFNASLKAFNLTIDGSAIEPANAQQLIIAVNGSLMNPVNDYTISGSVITFTTAPTGGHAFVGTLLGSALSLNTIADNTVGPTALTTTSNFRMNGLTLDQGAGIITAFGFQGGSITADLDSTFSANVSIAGSLTVQGTQTIINTDELNVQDKTIGIGSTNAPTSTTQDDAGVIIYGQTHVNILYDRDKAAVGINTGLSVAGFVTATRAQVGTGVTINNTGIDIGIGGIGIVTTGTVVATSATVGSGVTINNTGIDVGIGAGIVTASNFVGGGANITALSGSNIASGTVAAARVATLNQNTTGTSAGLTGTPDIDCGTGSFTGDVDVAQKIVHTGDTDTYIDFGTNSIALNAAGILAAQVTSDGRLGINTNNPQKQLEVFDPTAPAVRVNTGSKQADFICNSTGALVRTLGSYPLVFNTNQTDRAQFDSSGRLLVGYNASQDIGGGASGIQVNGTQNQISAARHTDNTSGPYLSLGKSRSGASPGVVVVQDGDAIGYIQFAGADGTDINSLGASIGAEVDGTPGSNDMPGRLLFKTTADGAASPTERLKITSTGGFQFSNGLFDEKVKITAGKLSDNTTIDLENGMVHYFTTQESTTATPNIRINSGTTLQTAMDTGDVCTVTLITTAAAGGYSADLNIDGNGVTEEWVGGAAPSAGSADGLDIYCYTIICIGTGTGDSGFKVIANLTNATN